MSDSKVQSTTFGSKERLFALGEWFGLAALAVLTVFFLGDLVAKVAGPPDRLRPRTLSSLADLERGDALPRCRRFLRPAFAVPECRPLQGLRPRFDGSGGRKSGHIRSSACAHLHALFRRAWGCGAAIASSAVFVAVFSFSQFYGGNHNFAAPYARGPRTDSLCAFCWLPRCPGGWMARQRHARPRPGDFWD